MASWDRGSSAFREEWLPRLSPFHSDLIAEMALKSGQAVKASAELEPFVTRAGADCKGRAPFDAIVVVSTPSSPPIEASWSDELGAHGKVGLLLWGPVDPDDPVARLERLLGVSTNPLETDDRAAIAERLHERGLALVRHTIVRHTLLFPRVEELADAIVRACTWRAEFESRGLAECAKSLARFYDSVGGPDRPVSWEPAAALVVAGLPGSEIELPHRPSVKIPLG